MQWLDWDGSQGGVGCLVLHDIALAMDSVVHTQLQVVHVIPVCEYVYLLLHAHTHFCLAHTLIACITYTLLPCAFF